MITHPEKVLFPDDGITKGEVADYYRAIAPLMIPHIKQRPLTIERFPAGIGKQGFIQKDVVKGFPDWLTRIEAPRKEGGTVHYPAANDVRSLEWLANQNTIAMHIWTSRAPRLDHPDICVFDLDPSREDFEELRAATLALRDLLRERGHESWVKTSGSKGFHIVVPQPRTATFDDSARFAGEIADALEAGHPDLFTQAFRKADRGGRILIDIARNRPGATVVAPYSVRAKPGAPVSAPCTWDEVESGAVLPQTFTLRSMADRVAAVGDVWAALTKRRAAAASRPRAPKTRTRPARRTAGK